MPCSASPKFGKNGLIVSKVTGALRPEHALGPVPPEAAAALEDLAAGAGEDPALVHGVAVVVERSAAVEPVRAPAAVVVQLLAAQQVVHEVAAQAEALAAALADVRLVPQVLAAHVPVQPLPCGEHPLAAATGAGHGVPHDVCLVAVQAVAAKAGGRRQVQTAHVAHVLLWLALALGSGLGCILGLPVGVFSSGFLYRGVVVVAVVLLGNLAITVFSRGGLVDRHSWFCLKHGMEINNMSRST